MVRHTCLAILALAASCSAQITFTSVSHEFNQVLDGQTQEYGVQMTNGSATAFSFALNLTGSSEFTQANNCGSTVAAGAKCEIVFSFAPKAAGAVSATWSLAANGQTFSPANGGTLSGTGVTTPAFSITSASHNFGTDPLHTPTGEYGVVLSNSTVNAINLTITAPNKNASIFPETANTCPAALSPDEECQLAWEFIPTAAGTLSVHYKINGTDATTGNSVILTDPQKKSVTEVDLTGTGTSASGVVLTTAGHTFADQGVKTTSPTYGAMLTNATTNPISLSYNSTGSTTSFPSQGSNCGATLAANASCDMQWAFDPQTTGTLQMSYAIAATSGGAPVTITSGGATVSGITLTGTGVSGTLGLAQSSNAFGAWVVDHTSPAFSTSLTNSTPYTVGLTYATTGTPADFPQTENTCTATLAPGGSCNLQWTFDPQTSGKLSSGLNITAALASGNIPLSVTSGNKTVNGISLSGVSETTAGVFLDTASNAFGELGVGGTSPSFSTAIYNTTNATVDLSFAYSNPNAAENFTLTTNNCGSALAANSSCTLAWEFTPIAAGTFSTVYDITATQGGQTLPLSSGGATVNGVTLHGTGVE